MPKYGKCLLSLQKSNSHFFFILKFKDFVAPFGESKKVLEKSKYKNGKKIYLLLTGGLEININLTTNPNFPTKNSGNRRCFSAIFFRAFSATFWRDFWVTNFVTSSNLRFILLPFFFSHCTQLLVLLSVHVICFLPSKE